MLYEIKIFKAGKRIAYFRTLKEKFIIDFDAGLKKYDVTPSVVKMVRDDVPPDVQEIKTIINEHSGLGDIFLKTRKGEYVHNRQLCHFFGWLLFTQIESKYTIDNLGLWMGGFTHANMLHSKNTVLDDLLYKKNRKEIYGLAIRFGCLKELNKLIKENKLIYNHS